MKPCLENLSELEQFVHNANVNSLKTFFKNSESSFDKGTKTRDIPNLVITACRFDRLDCLKYLLSKDTVRIIIKVNGEFYNPEYEDRTGHNAFYYSLLSSNKELIHLLINNWPDNLLNSHPDVLEGVLSSSYQELVINRVALSSQVRVYVLNRLLDLRFSCVSQPLQIYNLKSIKERIKLLSDSITNLLEFSEVNETVLYLLSFVAKTIYILKRILKFSYDKLPWEEIEFCCETFILSNSVKGSFSSLGGKEPQYYFCDTILNLSKIKNHLKNFIDRLKILDLKAVKPKLMCMMPNLTREDVVREIVQSCPLFQGLYEDHDVIRDLTSLWTIKDALDLANSANLSEREGRLIIFRSLHITGEFLKTTLEAPNLSKMTVDFVLLCLPVDTRKIIIQLRNALSHSYSLVKRMELEDDADLLTRVKKDLSQVSEVVNDALLQSQCHILSSILRDIIEISDLTGLHRLFQFLSPILIHFKVDCLMNMISDKMLPNALYKTVKKLHTEIQNKNSFEEQILQQLFKVVSYRKSDSKRNNMVTLLLNSSIVQFENLYNVAGNQGNLKEYDNILRNLKLQASQLLNQISPNLIEETSNNEVLERLMDSLFISVLSRKHTNVSEIYKLFCEMIKISNFNYNRNSGVKEIFERLTERSLMPSNPGYTNLKYHSSRIRQELDNFLLANDIQNCEDSFEQKLNDKRFLASIKVLLLDLMSTLASEERLENNILSLDDHFFTLSGKCLRNYLAHYNNLMNVLIRETDLVTVLILNAIKLVKGSVSAFKRNHDVSVVKIKLNLDRDLRNLNNKLQMFSSIQTGDLEAVQLVIHKGGEVFSRDIDLKTSLHYSVTAPGTVVVKHLLDKGVSPEFVSKYKDSALHVAAKHGSTEAARLLIEAGLKADILNYQNRSPLHLASKNGHEDTVLFFIKNGADKYLKDYRGHAPLHYAVEYNHKNIVVLLLAADHVDYCLTKGSYSCLIIAAENGHLELVRYLISRGADVNAKSDGGGTAILSASIRGHYKVVEMLIANGANVNCISFSGFTPLHNASECGYTDVVNLLVNNGAKVNAVESECGITPICLACNYGHIEVVKSLLKHGADPTIFPYNLPSPFFKSVLNNNKAIVSILIQQGFDINTKTNNGLTAMHLATQNASADIIDLLILNKADVNCKTNELVTPLYMASMKGLCPVIDALIKNGAKVNAKNSQGQTPLHAAASRNHKDAVALLLRYKAKLDSPDVFGQGPLHLSTIHRAKEAAEVLLHNSANVNMTDFLDCTPLHIASECAQSDITNLLIQHNANVNYCSALLGTPLFLAIEFGNTDTVKLLFNNGARLESRVETKRMIASIIKSDRKDLLRILMSKGVKVFQEEPSVLVKAIVAGSKGVVQVLLKNNVNIDYIINQEELDEFASSNVMSEIKSLRGFTPLLVASAIGNKDIVEMLVISGANLNSTISNGSSALHLAASLGRSEVVQVLLCQGIIHRTRDIKYRTPFELAVARGHVSTVDVFLIHKDIDVNEIGVDKWTPLHVAAKSGNLEIVISLVEYGADVNLKNDAGSKPVHIAVREGHINIVEYFVGLGFSVEECGTANQTLLHYAAEKGQFNIVEFLIKEQSAQLNVSDNNGCNPLHLAAFSGSKIVVEYLLNSGCFFNTLNINKKKPSEVTPYAEVRDILENADKLLTAAKKNDYSAISILIENGAVLNAVHSDFGAALHCAAWKGFEDVATTLLRKGCDRNVRDKHGFTPLHYAAKFGHYKLVLTLLSNGAIFNSLSNSSKTPFDLCKDKKSKDLINLISKCFEKVKSKDVRVIKDMEQIKDINILKALIKALDRESKSLMMTAVKFEFPKVIELQNILEGDFTSTKAMAELFAFQERYDEALNLLYDILEHKKQLLHDNEPGIVNLEKNIGKYLYKKQRYEESLELLKSVHEKQKKSLGENHKDTVDTNSAIALVLFRMGTFKESLCLFRKVSEIQRDILGPDHTDYIETILHMALVLDASGKHEEALTINYKVLDHFKQKYGDDHLQTLISYNNIAVVLPKLGRYDEAINIYKKVHKGRVKILGPDHSDTLRVLHNMAEALHLNKQTVEALKLLNQVLERQKASLGSKHVDVFNTQLNIANLHFNQGNFIEALKVYKECYDNGITILGPKHPAVCRVETVIHVTKQSLNLFGVDFDGSLKNYQKEFITAVSQGDSFRVTDLIKQGVFVNERDTEGRTPLHFAVSSGSVETITILLENNADVTLASDKGNTPLHTAVSKNNIIAVKMLLSRVSEKWLHGYINAKTKVGENTALHVAVRNDSMQIVECLLQHGAVYEVVNAEGKTPLELSQSKQVKELLRLVDKYFNMVGSNNSKLVDNIQLMDPKLIKIIQSARNIRGETLIEAMFKNRLSADRPS